MPHKDPERHRDYNRKYARFGAGLKQDAVLDAAKLLLDPKKPCIAFYRVFSEEPRAHNAGEAAQRQAVRHLVRGAELIGTYVQPEKSGPGQKKRPQLGAALAHCQEQGATLIIAKLGHLAASAPILSQLAASGVQFVACDMPHVNHLTIRKLASRAQTKERARAKRRLAAWAALKAKGYRPVRPTAEMTRRRLEAIYARSKAFTAEIAPALRAARHKSRTLAEIAQTLNGLGLKTRVGSSWNKVSVRRELKRAAGLPPRSERQIAAATAVLDAKTDSPAAASAAPASQGAPAAPAPAAALPPKKKRGPPAVKTQAISARMRTEISEGKLTAEQLDGFDEEALAARYKASRYTVRNARKEALLL